jgi:glycosyltransferase involved in cell wall biosynthesis
MNNLFLKEPIPVTEQSWAEDIQPVVSVFSWSYNHVNFIRQSIESILEQKTTFSIEIIIHDDASNDGTIEIIREYESKNPSLFRNIIQKENQWSRGNSVMDPLFKAPRGKYIALTHGDDYWTDPYKLQKQVDFLENNPAYNLCGHYVSVLKNDLLIEDKHPILVCNTYTFNDYVFRKALLPTASILFRNNIVFPGWVNKLYGGDRALLFLNAQKGKIRQMDFNGAVYRIHEGGIEQRYKKDKFSLPFRNISEEKIYFKVLNHKSHKLFKLKRILFNYLYIFIWSIVKIKPSFFFISFYNLFRYALFYLFLSIKKTNI